MGRKHGVGCPRGSLLAMPAAEFGLRGAPGWERQESASQGARKAQAKAQIKISKDVGDFCCRSDARRKPMRKPLRHQIARRASAARLRFTNSSQLKYRTGFTSRARPPLPAISPHASGV